MLSQRRLATNMHGKRKLLIQCRNGGGNIWLVPMLAVGTTSKRIQVSTANVILDIIVGKPLFREIRRAHNAMIRCREQKFL